MVTRTGVQIFGVDTGQPKNIKIVFTIKYQIYRIMASTESIQHFNRFSGSGRFQINVGHTRGTNEDSMTQAILIIKAYQKEL